MFDKLGRYYREQNISVTDFGCKHLAECKAVCKDFVPMREAFVGEEYDNGSYPRLLFVSSDSIGSREKSDRTLKAMRNYHQNLTKTDKRGHWYKTNALARRLLGETKEKPLPFGFDKTCRYFAFVNSAKCKDFFEGQKEGSRNILFLNCREFIKGEVDILQPDIIVAQGKKAAETLFMASYPCSPQVAMLGYPSTVCQIVQLEANHKAIKIVAKHPCARGRYGWKPGEEKQFTDWAAKSVQEFIQSHKPSE